MLIEERQSVQKVRKMKLVLSLIVKETYWWKKEKKKKLTTDFYSLNGEYNINKVIIKSQEFD
jgi:hypothetical protein